LQWSHLDEDADLEEEEYKPPTTKAATAAKAKMDADQKDVKPDVPEADAKMEEPLEEEVKEEDEIDPLDAFMVSVHSEVTELKAIDKQRAADAAKKYGKKAIGQADDTATGEDRTDAEKASIVSIVTRSAFSGLEMGKDKGEIIEKDADAPDWKGDEWDGFSGRMSLETKGKLIKTTDHSKIYYRPFRKQFYVEVPEISNMTKEEVDAYRLELEDIKVRGKNCPKPVRTWAQAGVSRTVLDVMKKYVSKPAFICQLNFYFQTQLHKTHAHSISSFAGRYVWS
jgi:ATP-dependent RNA helicase DDX46/PRP5